MRWKPAALALLAAQGGCTAIRVDNSFARRDTNGNTINAHDGLAMTGIEAFRRRLVHFVRRIANAV